MRKLYRDLVIIFALLLLFKGFVLIVDQNERVVKMYLGNPVVEITDPGVHARLPWPFNSIIRLDKRAFVYDSNKRDFTTRDKQTLYGDVFALVYIEDGIKFVQRAGGSLALAKPKIDDKIYSTAHNVIGMHNFHNIIFEDRNAVNDSMTEKSDASLHEFGLGTKMVRMKNANLSPDNAQSVYNRMISERRKIAGQYRSMGSSDSTAICSETNTKVKLILASAVQDSMKIVGEADARATRIYNYLNYRDSELYQMLLELRVFENTMTTGEGRKVFLLNGTEPHLRRALGKISGGK